MCTQLPATHSGCDCPRADRATQHCPEAHLRGGIACEAVGERPETTQQWVCPGCTRGLRDVAHGLLWHAYARRSEPPWQRGLRHWGVEVEDWGTKGAEDSAVDSKGESGGVKVGGDDDESSDDCAIVSESGSEEGLVMGGGLGGTKGEEGEEGA